MREIVIKMIGRHHHLLPTMLSLSYFESVLIVTIVYCHDITLYILLMDLLTYLLHF
jgi:hypothetical protein